MMLLDNLIRTVDGALSAEQCDYLIDMFERNVALQETQMNGKGQSLTRMNLMGSSHTPFREDLDYLTKVFSAGVEKYKAACGIQSWQFPKKYALEAIKIKRYEPDTNESFPDHIDVMDLEMSRRFLVMFIYLTDNEGGQTFVQDFVSPGKHGTMLLFPPMWPWVHSGESPVKTSKYILGSYLHYV